MDRRLYRSRRDRMIAGVAGGLGEYLGIDPVIVRIIFILLALATGTGVLLYVILWVVMPEAPAEMTADGPAPVTYHRMDPRERGLLVGGVLIALGVIFLLKELNLWWWLQLWRLWPLLLVGAGVLLLIDRGRSR